MNLSTEQPLRRISPCDVPQESRPPVDTPTLLAASEIVEAVRKIGLPAIRDYAQRFDNQAPSTPLVFGQAEMQSALKSLTPQKRAVLERTAERIRTFAKSQRQALQELDLPIPGGRVGHTLAPIANAGCYAPAGRYPLPSSVLMTAVTARVAGCTRVVVASPAAQPEMLAAAAIAGTDEFLVLGGAHAIAAMAYGFEGFDPCDVITGPGNKWVTAAKQLVSATVGIDMLAGPSELLIIADDSAEPAVVAADLLAQAEHDPDAVCMLITTSPTLADTVDTEITEQLRTLRTQATARAALQNSFVCIAETPEQMLATADRIAAEHVEIMTTDPQATADKLHNAGAVFIGANSAEVLGDYGAGPNHTLPTSRTARFQAGLSVYHFLRTRSWLKINDVTAARALITDAATLAEMEGLAGHRASALIRLDPEQKPDPPQGIPQ